MQLLHRIQCVGIILCTKDWMQSCSKERHWPESYKIFFVLRRENNSCSKIAFHSAVFVWHLVLCCYLYIERPPLQSVYFFPLSNIENTMLVWNETRNLFRRDESFVKTCFFLFCFAIIIFYLSQTSLFVNFFLSLYL